ncbi:MAG: HPr kinase/phosphatase C-terminal domain-containing protein [Pseudolabrys sp.]|nr:HPr kinase/phosphatase C-terminal domain-containing protein [Pseudolabrys sp.]MDP2297958.1 HPr kinase/phosphatase C-terminal domain-containing protein [Pseudolabrys sp.]
MTTSPTIHATAVLIGAKAVLIRGPSGSGKSTLAWRLIRASGVALPFTRLVADDRCHIEAVASRLLVRPAPALAGLIEIRGLGIRRLPYEPVAQVGLVVDLAAAAAARIPAHDVETVEVSGIRLPRLLAAPGEEALPLLLAWLGTVPGASPPAN